MDVEGGEGGEARKGGRGRSVSAALINRGREMIDRKSVGWGKSVGLGGRRNIKKKRKKKKYVIDRMSDLK